MEGTPLLRFVCATFAMRRRWEGKGEVALARRPPCARIEDEEDPALAASIGSVDEEIDAIEVVDSETDESSSLDDGGSDAMKLLAPVLAAVKAARGCVLSESLRRVVAEISEAATESGIFHDVVSALVMALVDVEDESDEALAQGLAEVLLLLCFERVVGVEEDELVPTKRCNEVLAQALVIQEDVFDLAGPDRLCSHVGVLWLNRTLDTVTEYLRSPNSESQSVAV